MGQLIAGAGLDAVADGVAQVQELAAAGVKFILLHQVALVGDAAGHHFLRVLPEVPLGQGVQQVGVRVFDERGGGSAHLAEVEGADVGRHADGDAHVGRDQHVRERGRQERRLLHGRVVVVDKIDGVGVDVAEQLGAERVELCLGVTRGGVGHVARVDLAEVALRVNKRMQQRFVAARKAHHRLIDGLIAVGVEAHGLADDVGGFCPRAGQKAHFVHRIQELAVRRLEAVDLRDGARDDDRHGVGHVVRLERIADGLLHGRAAQPLHLRIDPLFCFGFFFLCHFFRPLPSCCRRYDTSS